MKKWKLARSRLCSFVVLSLVVMAMGCASNPKAPWTVVLYAVTPVEGGTSYESLPPDASVIAIELNNRALGRVVLGHIVKSNSFAPDYFLGPSYLQSDQCARRVAAFAAPKPYRTPIMFRFSAASLNNPDIVEPVQAAFAEHLKVRLRQSGVEFEELRPPPSFAWNYFFVSPMGATGEVGRPK